MASPSTNRPARPKDSCGSRFRRPEMTTGIVRQRPDERGDHIRRVQPGVDDVVVARIERHERMWRSCEAARDARRHGVSSARRRRRSPGPGHRRPEPVRRSRPGRTERGSRPRTGPLASARPAPASGVRRRPGAGRPERRRSGVVSPVERCRGRRCGCVRPAQPRGMATADWYQATVFVMPSANGTTTS